MKAQVTIKYKKGLAVDTNLNLFTQHVINFKDVTGLTYEAGIAPGEIKLEVEDARKVVMRIGQVVQFAKDLYVEIVEVTSEFTDLKGNADWVN